MEIIKYSNEEIKTAFAKSLKELREYTGLTLIDLEKLTNINNPSLSRYENGKVEPSLSQAIYIADVFGLTVEDFIIFGLNEKLENSDSESIIERFNENISNNSIDLGDNYIKLIQKLFPKLNIKDILEQYK